MHHRISYRPATTPARPRPCLDERRRPRRLPQRRAPLARLPPDPRRHPPLVPHPGPPRQHRPDPRLAPGRPRLHRRGLLPGPRPAAPGRLPGRAPRPGRGPRPRTPEAEGRWRGHRTFLVDGSSFSMPDTPELRAHFGQPGRARPGLRLPGGPASWPCSTPAPGCCWRSSRRRCGPTRWRRRRRRPPAPRPGRRAGRRPRLLLVRCTWRCSPPAASTPCSASTRRQIVDFTPDRPHAGRDAKEAGQGPPAVALAAAAWASATRWSSGSSRASGRSG